MTRERARRRAEARARGPVPTDEPAGWIDPAAVGERLRGWLFGPQPVVRLVLVRLVAPLVILGFLSNRIAYVDDWFSTAGFHVPRLGHGDYREPFYLAPLAPGTARAVCVLLVASGLAMAAGAWARLTGLVFAACMGYVALADRLAAFTVTKLGCVLAVALWLTPSNARCSIDAWRARARDGQAPRALPTLVSGGNVRFFQILLVVFYCASGVAKSRGDWLTSTPVIWTHLHDSYQTAFAYAVARLMPAWSWWVFQGVTVTFETLAPLWLFWRRSRPFAVAWGVAMHAMIGLMFGPLGWFSSLMILLLVACFGPEPWLGRVLPENRAKGPAVAAPTTSASPPNAG